MEKKAARFPFIMGIAAFICFLIVALFASNAVQPPWGPLLLLLIPSAVLCSLGVLARKGVLNARKTAVLTVILSVLFLLLSAVYLFLLSIWAASLETTDTKYYRRAYRLIEDRAAVKEFFPPSVPEDGREVSFSYSPPVLQGGEVFRLSYKTDEDRIREWSERLSPAAEWVGANDEWLREHHRRPDGRDAVRYQLYWDGGSNHGEICYVLIGFSDGWIEFYYSNW